MAELENAAVPQPPTDAPKAPKTEKKKSVRKGGAVAAVRVRCRQSGFRASIPAEDWNAYTPAQRAAYEIMEG